MAFGVLFFGACCVGSVALTFFPPHNEGRLMVMPFCAVAHAVFAALCVFTLRMDDTIEVSEKGITSRRKHKPDIEFAWEEVVAVDASLQGCCLKLRTADERMIRVKYQFNDMPELLNLLERNLPLLENSVAKVSFKRIVVEPTRIIRKSIFRPRVIEMNNIRDIRMELINNALFILIQERGSDKAVKLMYSKRIFHLGHHERMLDTSER